MKLLKLITLLAAPLMFSQTMRFVYQVTTTPDSTNVESRATELAYLDTDGKKSYFYGEKRLKRDSVMERMRTTRSFDPSQMENLRSNIDYIIEKNIPDQEVTFKTRIARDQYSYNEKPEFSWKILSETIKIGDYKTQKAETTYGGRTQYAWFTQEIPLQEGPYKFNGLPGLIVKIQDKDGDYSFDLMQTKKISEIKEPQTRGQYINVPKKKYLALESEFKKDPEATFNIQRSNGGGFGGPGGPQGGGSPSVDRTKMQEMRERMLKEIKSNNNPIELK